MPLEHFLHVSTVLPAAAPPELQRAAFFDAWDVEDEEDASAHAVDFKAHAAAAMQRDAGLNSLNYRCVPRRTSEAQFWWLYYTWVHQLLLQRQSLRARPRATEAEMHTAQAAEEQTESVEALVARYDAEILEPLRAEAARLRAAYNAHLADSTGHPGMHPSEAHARMARAHRKAIEAAEEQLEDARDGLREHMAIMQKQHRKGRAWAH